MIPTLYKHFTVNVSEIGIWVIFTDLDFIIENEREIQDYLKTCLPTSHFQGLVIEFERHEDLAMFLLRWS